MKKNVPTTTFVKFLINNIDLFLTLLLALIGIYIFYPGAMSLDSVAQWLQVLHPEWINSWHPPLMVYLWLVLNRITPGPQGMLIFHYVIYFLSIYILANIFYSKTIHRIIYIFVIGLFPPVFFLIGVIWKDISMLVAFSMSFALLFKFEASTKKIWLLLSVCFLLYGVGVRHNAIVCLIPYIIYILLILINAEKRKKIILITILTPLLFFGGFKLAHFVNDNYIEDLHKVYQLENSAFIWDLWGMSIELEENILPNYLFNDPNTSLTLDQLKSHYDPYWASVIFLPMLNQVRWKKGFPDKTFKKDFIKLVIQHPAAYLKVRSRIVIYMLGIKRPILLPYLFRIYKPWAKDDWLYEASKDIEFSNKEVLLTAKSFAHLVLTKTPLYMAWIYFILIFVQFAGIFLYKEALGRHFKQYLLILSIGIIYWLPFTIFSASADFRYSHLTVYCSIIMIPILIQSMHKHHKNRDRKY